MFLYYLFIVNPYMCYIQLCEELYRYRLKECHTHIMRFPLRAPQLELISMSKLLRKETCGEFLQETCNEFLPRTGSVENFMTVWNEVDGKLNALIAAVENAYVEYEKTTAA